VSDEKLVRSLDDLFLDADQNDSGLRVELQSAAGVDRFLEAFRAALTLDVEGAHRP